jgi:hypothetical protein
MKKMYWRKSKTLAMLANRRQWSREFHPPYTSEVEIQTEDGLSYIVIESSSIHEPNYIITE